MFGLLLPDVRIKSCDRRQGGGWRTRCSSHCSGLQPLSTKRQFHCWPPLRVSSVSKPKLLFEVDDPSLMVLVMIPGSL